MPIKLGSNTFVVPPPGGMRSFALQQRILPVASRVVNVFLHFIKETDVKNLGDILEADVLEALPKAIPYLGQIFAEMPPGELEAVTRALLGEATFDKLPLFSPSGDAFDALMAGRTLDTWKLLGHALKVWYPDFFALASGFAAKSADKGSPSEESTTSDPPGPASASSSKAGRVLIPSRR